MAKRGVYYNEHDPHAADWLCELIAEGYLPEGEVDERDIQDVEAADLIEFHQCHFFAGIGGWAYALQLASWPHEYPVWTGSCPCQPFSAAGKRHGLKDARHLWPHWARLIRECRPVTIFGEQVESAIAHGWLDAVFDDLEREGYACGAACLPAASVGAPHRRDRLWFVGRCVRPDSNGCEANGRDFGMPIRRQWRQTDDEAVSHTPRTVWSDQPRPPIVADGLSASVGLVCGYGNAIVPQVAAEVIRAYMDVRGM